ncbi:MAG: TrbI/VirB10 family protein [Candidatus Melainabacteria bacterium]|nr:TrbI/VirB10 family protein [Candidatus Melainabacteria bacterium]
MFSSKAICLAASLMLAVSPATTCAVLAADPQLNFKIYSPQDPPAESPSADATKSEVPDNSGDVTNAASTAAAPAESSIFDEESSKASVSAPVKETPVVDTTPTSASAPAESLTEPSAAVDTSTTTSTTTPAAAPAAAEASSETSTEVKTDVSAETSSETKATTSVATKDSKVLQGYIRVVPTGTKIPIVMDTAVDSDTSQEGDEFSARTSEDLTIDGSTVVPAGSIIKGRIATLNSPRALNRSGSVALKFDNITTPDNRQIPLVATIVARGGVVHARRGMKDIAIDTGTVALPFVAGLAIGALAGNSSNSSSSTSSSSSGMSKGAAAALGAGIGLAVGIAVLCAKKGKKIEVRPGDELKIELAEELRMPTM